MTKIAGSAALVTGAAHGIGRALAEELARRGCDVALADRDDAGMRDVAQSIAATSRVRTSQHVVDMGDAAGVAGMAQDVLEAHPRLNLLFNNAGVALFGQFHEVSAADMDWLMNINFWGVVNATRALLAHLEAQPAAHIVNTSSIFGIIAPPGQTAYAAAKFAVRGFSEALRHELDKRNSTVKLSVVHPGGIATDIARRARVGTFMTDTARHTESVERFDAMVQTSPENAALRILSGIEANAPRILIGPDARRMDLLQRLKPATYWATIAKKLEKTIAKAGRGERP